MVGRCWSILQFGFRLNTVGSGLLRLSSNPEEFVQAFHVKLRGHVPTIITGVPLRNHNIHIGNRGSRRNVPTVKLGEVIGGLRGAPPAITCNNNVGRLNIVPIGVNTVGNAYLNGCGFFVEHAQHPMVFDPAKGHFAGFHIVPNDGADIPAPIGFPTPIDIVLPGIAVPDLLGPETTKIDTIVTVKATGHDINVAIVTTFPGEKITKTIHEVPAGRSNR